jgi:hypothetical protein
MQKILTLKFAAVVAALTLAFAGAPAVAAPSLKPTVTSVDNTKPAAGGGTPITVSGTNLGTVTSITVDNSYATVASKSATALTFLAPQHALGVATVLITNPAGTATFTINYSPQRRPLVPSPTLPATLRLNASYTVKAQEPSWKVTLTTDTPKICSTKGATVKGIKRGSCVVNIDINPDPVSGSNPNWRGKVVVDSLLIK